jgi:hypothetical protein
MQRPMCLPGNNLCNSWGKSIRPSLHIAAPEAPLMASGTVSGSHRDCAQNGTGLPKRPARPPRYDAPRRNALGGRSAALPVVRRGAPTQPKADRKVSRVPKGTSGPVRGVVRRPRPNRGVRCRMGVPTSPSPLPRRCPQVCACCRSTLRLPIIRVVWWHPEGWRALAVCRPSAGLYGQCRVSEPLPERTISWRRSLPVRGCWLCRCGGPGQSLQC